MSFENWGQNEIIEVKYPLFFNSFDNKLNIAGISNIVNTVTSSHDDLPTSAAVQDYVNTMNLNAFSWQRAVHDFFDPTSALPSNPISGDRWISSQSGNGWIKNYIYTYTTSWSGAQPANGWITVVLDNTPYKSYIFNATDWVIFNTSIDGSTILWGTTESSSITTGSLVIPGGMGIAKNLFANKIETSKNVNQPKFYGAIGDGATDDTNAINSCITGANSHRISGDNAIYSTTTVDNPFGVRMDNDMKVVQTNSKYTYMLYDSYAYDNAIFNVETLAGWFNKLMKGTLSKICLSGDSTSWGSYCNAYKTNTFDVNGTPSVLLSNLFHNDDINTVTVLNRGQPGQTSTQWKNSNLAADIATNSDLYIFRWGINDGIGADYNPTTFMNNLRDCLTTFRTTYPITSGVGCIVMTPNSICRNSDKRDNIWNEKLTNIIKRACVDFSCGFIDTYALWQNSRDGVHGAYALWMADQLHPATMFNHLIWGKVYEIIAPKYHRDYYKKMYNPTLSTYQTSQSVGNTFYLSGCSLTPENNVSGLSNFKLTFGTELPSLTANEGYITNLADIGISYNLSSYLGNVDTNPQFGTIAMKYKFNSAGSNSIFALSSPGYIWLYWASNKFGVIVKNSSDVVEFSNSSYASFVPVLGVEYDIEFTWDFTNGITRLFVDGSQLSTTIPNVLTRSSATTFLLLGYNSGWSGRSSISNVAFIPSILHTSNFTISHNGASRLTPNSIKCGDGSKFSELTANGLNVPYNPVIIPDNAAFYSTFNNSLNANYNSSGSTSVTNTNFYISNKSARAGAVGAKMIYNNVANGSIFSVRFMYNSGYNGTPSTSNGIFSFYDTTANNNRYLILYHSNNGRLLFPVYSDVGTLVATMDFGLWVPVAGVNREFLLNVDLTNGSTQLFIDGTQFGATDTTITSRTQAAILQIGSNISSSFYSLFNISKFIVYSVAPYTSNYIANTKYELSETLYQSNISGNIIFNNDVNISSTTQSVSSTTGSVIVSGGLGIAKNLNVGGTFDVVGETNLSSVIVNTTTNSESSSTGSLIVAGGLGVAKNINIGGDLHTNGNILCHGETSNMWLPKYVYLNGADGGISYVMMQPEYSRFNHSTESVNVDSGAVQVVGGCGITKRLNVGGNANFAGTLDVSGGMGVGQNLNIGGNTNITTTSVNQLSVGYDAINKILFNVSSGGDLTIDASGNDINMASTDTVRILTTTNSNATNTGGLVVSGGVGVAKNLYVGGELKITNTTQATSNTTGALIVAGGASIGNTFISSGMGSVNQYGINVIGNTNATNATIGLSITNQTNIFDKNYQILLGGLNSTVPNCASGELGFYNASFNTSLFTIGATSCTFYHTTNSLTTGTGALQVRGGVGIAKDLNVGGNISFVNKTALNLTSTGGYVGAITGNMSRSGNIVVVVINGVSFTGSTTNPAVFTALPSNLPSVGVNGMLTITLNGVSQQIATYTIDTSGIITIIAPWNGSCGINTFSISYLV